MLLAIHSFEGATPLVAGSAWIAETAWVCGKVEIGERATVWPGGVIRGDFGSIRIGANTHIQDNSVLHTGDRLEIGDDTIVGHRTVVHCAVVGDNVLVGNGAILLDDAVIGSRVMIAAGAVVLRGAEIPDDSFVTGLPATAQAITDRQRRSLLKMSDPEWGYGTMAARYKAAGL